QHRRHHSHAHDQRLRDAPIHLLPSPWASHPTRNPRPIDGTARPRTGEEGDAVILLGVLLLTAGAGGLIINAAAWLAAHRAGRRTERLHGRRRTLAYSSTAAVVVGTALVWTTLLVAP